MIFKKFVIQHASEILTGIVIVGVSATGFFSGVAGYKIALKVNALKQENPDISNKELAKACAPYVIPPLGIGIMTAGSALGSHHIMASRVAGLMTLYSTTEAGRKELSEKIKENLGEVKERDLAEKTSEALMDKHPPREESIIKTGYGDTLFYDSLSDRYFYSDPDTVNRGLIEAEKIKLHEMWLSVNELYDCLGLPHTQLGPSLGWTIDDDLKDIVHSSHLREDGKTAHVLDFHWCMPRNSAGRQLYAD